MDMPTASSHLKVLGDFLRSRRAEVDPQSLLLGSVPVASRRRFPGLRREEISQVAGISTDYYTRVEQGRMAPSPQVLESLCRILCLNPEQTAYAKDLLNHIRGITDKTIKPGPADDRLQLLLEQLKDLPAMVLGPQMDILAWNPLASALIIDFDNLPVDQRNYAILTFTVPAMKTLYEDWESVARTCVGILRREAVQDPDNPKLATLVGRLSISDANFRRWWAAHQINEQDFGTKIYNHPSVGRMRLNWDSFTYAGAVDQQLILWSAPPHTPDADALRMLAQI